MEGRLFVISLKTMSKIASKPIELISDVKFDLKDNVINIQGPKGSLEFIKPSDVIVEQSDNIIKVSTKSESTAMSGTTRSLISNLSLIHI